VNKISYIVPADTGNQDVAAAFVGLRCIVVFAFRAGLAWRFCFGFVMASSCLPHNSVIFHTVKGHSKGKKPNVRTGETRGSLGLAMTQGTSRTR